MVVNRGPAAAGSVLDVQFPAQESSSRASTVTLNDSDTGRKRALLIGIRKVKGYAKLKGAHDDVHKMSALLKDLYHYTPADITVLLDDKIDGHVKPTRANILNAITDFVKDVKAGDRLFFHYSGHSTQVPNQSNSEEDGKDECLVPLDGEDNLIVDDELHAHLVVPLPAGAHLVAVLDTCHSGSLLDLKHYRCNRVFVPWVFPGNRNSEDKRQGVTRRGALFLQLSAFSKRSTLPPADTLSPANAFPTAPAWILPDDQRCDSPVARFPCDGWCGHHRTQDVDADDIKADVISLASCKDSQRAWEDVKDGVRITMTSALVEILRKDPNRSLKEVLMKISHATHTMALDRHREGKGYMWRRKEYLAKNEKLLEKKLLTLARSASKRSLVLPDPAPARARLAPAWTFPRRHEKKASFGARLVASFALLAKTLWDVRRRGGFDMDSFQNPELASPQPLDMSRKWCM